MNIAWRSVSELKQQELFLLQQSYEERNETRQKVLHKSQTIVAASNAVSKLCSAADGLRDLLAECHALLLRDGGAATAQDEAEEPDLAFTSPSFNKDWLVEVLLQEDSLESAMLLDMGNTRISEHVLNKLAAEPTDTLVRYFALTTKAQSITCLADSIEVNMRAGRLRPILLSLLTPSSITVSPCPASSISYALGLDLRPKTFTLALAGCPEDVQRIMQRREAAATARLLGQLESRTDDADTVAVLLQADDELESVSGQLLGLVKEQLKGQPSLQVVALLSRFPPKYQRALSGELLARLDECGERLDVDAGLFHDPAVKQRIAQAKAKRFEAALLQKITDAQHNPAQVLFDAASNLPTDYAPSTTITECIADRVPLGDLEAMRLLLHPLVSSGQISSRDNTDNPPPTSYDLLPSPNTLPLLPRIPVKADKRAPLQDASEHTLPAASLSSPTPQLPSPRLQSTTKDPLQSFKKMLQF